MAEAHGSLCLGDGVCRLDDVAQQVTLCERHDALGQRGRTVVDIPADVAHTPEGIQLFLGEQRVHVGSPVVALHVGDHLEQVGHQGVGIDSLLRPLGVVEQHPHEAACIDVLHVVAHLAALASHGLHQSAAVLVHVVLQGLADVVVDDGGGVGCRELFALGNHRQDAAVDGGRTGIDVDVLCLEDFGEVLHHAASDAVMLALADRRQVAQSQLCAAVLAVQSWEVGLRQADKSLQQLQHLLALGSQLACLPCRAQGFCHAGVAVVLDEPARAVASVVRHVVGYVALGGWSQLLGGQLAVVVQIVAACQVLVGPDFLAGRLCGAAERDGSRQQQGSQSFHSSFKLFTLNFVIDLQVREPCHRPSGQRTLNLEL